MVGCNPVSYTHLDVYKRQLVATFHSARSQGATLKLANLGSKFKEVLQVTKLMTVFDTYDSEALAVQSFAK